MKLFKITTSVLTVLTAGSAFAADLPSRRAPAPYVAPVPLMTWTGFHVGVNAGATFGGNSTATTVGAPTFLNPAAAPAPGLTAVQNAVDASYTNILGIGTRTGALLGVQAGYDYQFYNAFLLGFEADAQGVLSGGTRGLFSNNQAIAGGLGTVQSLGFVQKRTDWLATVRARLGYTITPSFLLYVTGGLAVGGVKASTAVTTAINLAPGLGSGSLPNTGAYGGYSSTRVGYTIGAGAEYMFLPNFSLKAEYLYYDLGSASYNALSNTFGNPNNTAITGVGAGLISQDAVRTRVRYDGHLARVGVNYHFWSPVAAPVVARY